MALLGLKGLTGVPVSKRPIAIDLFWSYSGHKLINIHNNRTKAIPRLKGYEISFQNFILLSQTNITF